MSITSSLHETLTVTSGEKVHANILTIREHLAVYLHTADKYRRFTRRPPKGQKDLNERAHMVS